jgi:Spy/CpxP family protein refolding chaperone
MLKFRMLTLPALLLVLGTALAFGGAGKDDHAGKHADRMVSRMEKQLDLTKEQSAKIRAILVKDTSSMPHRGMWKKGDGCEGCEKCSGHGMGMMGGHGEFAKQMRAATIDTQALNKSFEDRQSRMQAMHAAHVARFVEIHAVLTPEQRAKLADKLEKRSAKMDKKCEKKCGKSCKK